MYTISIAVASCKQSLKTHSCIDCSCELVHASLQLYTTAECCTDLSAVAYHSTATKRPNIIVSRRAHALRWLLVELVLAALMVFFPVLVALLSYAVSADQLTLHSHVIYR